MPFPLETWTWPANCGANSHPSVLQQNPLQRWIMMSQITVLHASSSRHVRGLFRGIHLNCLHASQFPSHLSIPEGLWRKAERTPDNLSPDCTGALEMSSLQPASRSEMVSGFEEEIRSLMALFSREMCNYARQWEHNCWKWAHERDGIIQTDTIASRIWGKARNELLICVTQLFWGESQHLPPPVMQSHTKKLMAQ